MPVAPVAPVAALPPAQHSKPQGQRSIFDAAQGSFVTAEIHARDGLAAGALQAGPAAIVEDETTIIIPVSRNAVQQPDGCIDIIRKDGAA